MSWGAGWMVGWDAGWMGGVETAEPTPQPTGGGAAYFEPDYSVRKQIVGAVATPHGLVLRLAVGRAHATGGVVPPAAVIVPALDGLVWQPTPSPIRGALAEPAALALGFDVGPVRVVATGRAAAREIRVALALERAQAAGGAHVEALAHDLAWTLGLSGQEAAALARTDPLRFRLHVNRALARGVQNPSDEEMFLLMLGVFGASAD